MILRRFIDLENKLPVERYQALSMLVIMDGLFILYIRIQDKLNQLTFT